MEPLILCQLPRISVDTRAPPYLAEGEPAKHQSIHARGCSRRILTNDDLHYYQQLTEPATQVLKPVASVHIAGLKLSLGGWRGEEDQIS